MKHSKPSNCQDMEKSAEHPARKRQRSSTGTENDDCPPCDNVFDPVGTTMSMTAEEFTIPTINRCDIDNFCLSAITIRENEKEEESSSPTIMDGDAITKAFEKYQAIYLPQYFSYPSNDENNKSDNNCIDDINNSFRWNDLSSIFENLNESDKKSFCIENENAAESLAKDGSSDDEKNKDTGSSSFLKDQQSTSSSAKTKDDNRVGYCSFMIQNDKEALSDLLPKLPVLDPVATATSKFVDVDVGSDCKSGGDRCGWDYEPCLWIFFGRNNSNSATEGGKDLEGRPEHTDQISHDGTWHYQLSGTKRWLLRPTPQLLRRWKQDADTTNNNASNREDENTNHSKCEDTNEAEAEEETDIEPKQMRIDCRQGDVLIVNTRLWRHQTILPPQTEPSVSYARDFWIHKDDRAKSDRSDDAGAANAKAVGEMTNVDGLYAMDDIAEDTVLFKADDMPDCELHRTSEADKANCKIVELEDGIQAVVSSKFIKAGEFFCIPESSDEEDSDDEEIESCWLEAGEEDDE